jgi:hypothetical protein
MSEGYRVCSCRKITPITAQYTAILKPGPAWFLPLRRMLLNISKDSHGLWEGRGLRTGECFLWARFMNLTYRNPVESEVDLFARILSACANMQKRARYLWQFARRIWCKSLQRIKYSFRTSKGTLWDSCTSSSILTTYYPRTRKNPLYWRKISCRPVIN